MCNHRLSKAYGHALALDERLFDAHGALAAARIISRTIAEDGGADLDAREALTFVVGAAEAALDAARREADALLVQTRTGGGEA